MVNLSLFTTKAVIILDAEGNRVLAKYYGNQYPNLKDQRVFEKSLHEKTKQAASEIILYDGHVIVYKIAMDVFFYLVGTSEENELLLSSVLSAFYDAVNGLLRQSISKATIQENMDLVVLALDECIDDGIVLEIEPQLIISRVSKRSEDVPISEQSLLQAYQTAKVRFAGSLLK